MAHNSLLRFWSCYWTEEAYMTERRSSTTKSSRTSASLLPWELQEVGGMRLINASFRSSVSSASPSLQWSHSTLSTLPLSKATPEWVSLSHINQCISESQSFHHRNHLIQYFSNSRTPSRKSVIKSLTAHWSCTTTSSKTCHPLLPSSTTSSTWGICQESTMDWPSLNLIGLTWHIQILCWQMLHSEVYVFKCLCFTGFLSNSFLTVTQFVRLWRNECLRIFHDRLIDESDKVLVIIIHCRSR